MPARDAKRRRTSPARPGSTGVVGSRLSDVSAGMRGRGLPRGGLREQDRLKVAQGALPDSTLVGAESARQGAHALLRTVALVSGLLLAILVVVGLAGLALSRTSLFEVTSIETVDSAHISSEEVARLAELPEGVTLLSVDTQAVETGIKRNPWVHSVTVERVFPDTLRLTVEEREVGALVAMSTGGVLWTLGSDGAWIEPVPLERTEGESFNDAALAKAHEMGVVLICDVPTTVSPKGGYEATDKPLRAVRTLTQTLSQDFLSQIACYSASSENDISCLLTSGIEVAMGSATDIENKEKVVLAMLDEYAGQITYINVRVPSHPTFRRIDSDFVREGSGATGDPEGAVEIIKVRAYEGDDIGDDGEMQTDGGNNPQETSDALADDYEGSE